MLRFRSGQVQLRKYRVESATVIDTGDLVYLDSNAVKPASDFTWNTDLATTQSDFAAVFVGVAREASASGETESISIDVSPFSVYEFGVNLATYEVGDLLGPDESSSALMDQQLEAVGSDTGAIGRAVEFVESASSVLRVSFASAFSVGSSNRNSHIG